MEENNNKITIDLTADEHQNIKISEHDLALRSLGRNFELEIISEEQDKSDNSNSVSSKSINDSDSSVIDHSLINDLMNNYMTEKEQTSAKTSSKTSMAWDETEYRILLDVIHNFDNKYSLEDNLIAKAELISKILKDNNYNRTIGAVILEIKKINHLEMVLSDTVISYDNKKIEIYNHHNVVNVSEDQSVEYNNSSGGSLDRNCKDSGIQAVTPPLSLFDNNKNKQNSKTNTLAGAVWSKIEENIAHAIINQFKDYNLLPADLGRKLFVKLQEQSYVDRTERACIEKIRKFLKINSITENQKENSVEWKGHDNFQTTENDKNKKRKSDERDTITISSSSCIVTNQESNIWNKLSDALNNLNKCHQTLTNGENINGVTREIAMKTMRSSMDEFDHLINNN